mmetsp:Transcript_12483/g.18322  ORF Transcript_12483/g.18322 Transcript_12483/m.18322 type:complete len:180 (+) Transcript_12483:987-1526(+)
MDLLHLSPTMLFVNTSRQQVRTGSATSRHHLLKSRLSGPQTQRRHVSNFHCLYRWKCKLTQHCRFLATIPKPDLKLRQEQNISGKQLVLLLQSPMEVTHKMIKWLSCGKKLYGAVIKDGLQPKTDSEGRPVFFFLTYDTKACYTAESGLGMCVYEYRAQFMKSQRVGIELESGSLTMKK